MGHWFGRVPGWRRFHTGSLRWLRFFYRTDGSELQSRDFWTSQSRSRRRRGLKNAFFHPLRGHFSRARIRWKSRRHSAAAASRSRASYLSTQNRYLASFNTAACLRPPRGVPSAVLQRSSVAFPLTRHFSCQPPSGSRRQPQWPSVAAAVSRIRPPP